MKQSDDLNKLLRLKRYESPGEQYFGSFLDDFKDRQRSGYANRSSCSTLAGRLGVWFEEQGSARWTVPVVAATAGIGVGILMAAWAPTETGADSRVLVITPEMPNGEEISENFEITIPQLDTELPSFNPELQSPHQETNQTPSVILPTNYRQL